MTGWQVALLVVGIVIVDTVVISALIRSLIGGTWNKMAEKHPFTEPPPEAIRKNFQSLKVGLLNMGWSVHLAVDADHLHLMPAKFFRVMRARPISLPWDALVLKSKRKRYSDIKVGMTIITVPTWCVEMLDSQAS